MKVNANEAVSVTLTMTGAAIYNDWMGQFPHNIRERVQPGQTIKLPLWSLMQIFGPSIHMGMHQVPFVDNVMDLHVSVPAEG
jgi:hypothetical protein